MNKNQPLVYFDTFQCENFNIQYFEDDTCVLRASDILKSKSYDTKHTDLLGSFGDQDLHLERTGYKGQEVEEGKPLPWESPGWYRVTNVTMNG